MNNLKDLIDKFDQTKILLIGDIMLDRFVHGDVRRISPEGPIPVLSVMREHVMLGGAGNVYANLRTLGCDVEIISLIGQDMAGREIADRIEDMDGNSGGLYIDEDRPTSLKTRYLAQNQQLLRVDQEEPRPIDQDTVDQMTDYIAGIIEGHQAVILSDYGKGLLSPNLIKNIIRLAKKNKIPVIVDPKGKDFSIYRGATIVTPNKKELFEATNGMAVKTAAEIEQTACHVMKNCGIENIIATRSEDGISIIPKKGKATHLPTIAQEVYDVSGAGDSVAAVMALAIAAGASLEDAAMLANVAGGVAVSKVGTSVIYKDELKNNLAQMKNQGAKTLAPIMEWENAKDRIEQWQAQGLKVGFTNGCFDILHYGHVNYLNQARAKCDRLVLALNHDTSVKILKGESRPINDQLARATVMAALGSIDMVVFFGAEEEGQDNTPCEIVGSLKPDVLMKGGDYTVDQLPEGQVVLSYGGEVDIMPLYEGYSTTNIIEKSKQ